MKKYIIIIIIIVLIGLAQLIRPERNNQTTPSRYDVFHLTETPAIVISALKTHCYDCHSNYTNYPWYASIAPASWIIDRSIIEGKSKVNFSEWILYNQDEQEKILLEMMEVLEKKEMPPSPYLWMHKEAKPDQATIELLVNWAKEKKQNISLN